MEDSGKGFSELYLPAFRWTSGCMGIALFSTHSLTGKAPPPPHEALADPLSPYRSSKGSPTLTSGHAFSSSTSEHSSEKVGAPRAPTQGQSPSQLCYLAHSLPGP